MRELFFANETWRITGEGGFEGIFRLFRGGFNLAGQFSGTDVAVNQWAFPELHGTLVWEPRRFTVTHADARFLGGNMRFTYGLEPIGVPGTGATARVTADYEGVDLGALIRHPQINWDVLEPAGPAPRPSRDGVAQRRSSAARRTARGKRASPLSVGRSPARARRRGQGRARPRRRA